jgi:hypothetical protein
MSSRSQFRVFGVRHDLEGREADRKVKLRDCLLNNAEIMSWWEQAKTTDDMVSTYNNPVDCLQNQMPLQLLKL